MGRTACTEPQCLYKGDLYLYLYLSACTRVTFTLPLPQCLYKGDLYLYLSACTRVHFTLHLNLLELSGSVQARIGIV